MDPVQKMWMYNNWIEDQNDQAELAKNHAYLLASFWNPEAVQEILGNGNSHKSTDEEYEDSLRIVREQSIKLEKDQDKSIKRKRRRKHNIAE
jgi:hypothetical protein